MTESLEEIKRLISSCSEEDRRRLAVYLKEYIPHHPLEDDWGVDAQTILSAIRRSSDLTKRGVRGIIAEAIFDSEVVPKMSTCGWWPSDIPPGDWPFDALLERNGVRARIQIKLQRSEVGIPKRFYPRYYEPDLDLYVVEVQKTRTGKRPPRKVTEANEERASNTQPQDTRPYRFGDFDILAVNMQPSTQAWTNFRYTVSNWLIPRSEQPSLIEIFQPVPLHPSDAWTDDLETCLNWWLSGEKKRIIDVRHKRHSRIRKKST
jgi:hypothetical protein